MFRTITSRLLFVGLLLWASGTVGIRLAGHRLLRPGAPALTVVLYAVSFVLMGILVRRICGGAGLPKGAWPRGAILLALPTLVLDPFSCLFITTVFPNLDPAAAVLFGGWILICCAGGVAAGVLVEA